MDISAKELESDAIGEGQGPVDQVRAEKIFATVQSLRGMAINLTRNSVKAEDLLGDVTLKLVTKKGSYDEQWNLRARVGKAIFNTFLDGEKQKPTVSLEDIPVPPNLSIWWWEMSWPEHASFRDLKDVTEAINGLSPTIRDPFKLYMEGVSYEEIPEELGDPGRLQNTVRSQIHKARKAIRSKFPDLFKLYAPNPKWGKK